MRLRLLCLVALAVPLLAQNRYPPEMPEARTEVYKSVDGVELRAWIFAPDGHAAEDRRAAVVFFFGGGWRNGTPTQFREHSKHLAERGMVAVVADYRVASRHGVKAKECVEDAKAAVRWLRANAFRLGVDPDRIAAGGGSAGGHLAAAAAMLPGFDDPAGDKSVSAVPDALALFNPAVVMAPEDGFEQIDERRVALEDRIGAPLESFSPYPYVWKGAPPTIMFHGKADTTVPYLTAEMFCDAMKAKGNRCDLEGYDGAGHGFFNFGRGDGSAYRSTLSKLDAFFVSLGWLDAQ